MAKARHRYFGLWFVALALASPAWVAQGQAVGTASAAAAGQGGSGGRAAQPSVLLAAAAESPPQPAASARAVTDPERQRVRDAKAKAESGALRVGPVPGMVVDVHGALRGRPGMQPNDGEPPLKVLHATGHDTNLSAPPDPHLAVGPQDMVSTVNYHLSVHDKLGNPLIYEKSLFTWFTKELGGATAGAWQIWDPWVVYDALDNRFVLLAMAVNFVTSQSLWLISVSQTQSAAGAWCTIAFDGRMDNGTDSGLWIDYPKAGVTGDAVVMTAVKSSFTSPGALLYGKVRVFLKSDLYDTSCPATVPFTDFIKPKLMSGREAFHLQPAHGYVAGVPAGYLLSADMAGDNELTLWLVSTQIPTAPVLLRLGAVPTRPFSPPPNAFQQGTGTRIETGDARLLGAMLTANGRLWTSHTVACRWPGDPFIRACGRFYEIDPLIGTASQQVTFGAPEVYAFFPQVAANAVGAGDVMIAYARSSITSTPSARVIGRKHTDPPNTLRPSTEQQASLDCYLFLVKGKNRWGDYLGMAVDPFVPGSFWAHGQYAKGTNTPTPPCTDQWATTVDQFVLP